MLQKNRSNQIIYSTSTKWLSFTMVEPKAKPYTKNLL